MLVEYTVKITGFIEVDADKLKDAKPKVRAKVYDSFVGSLEGSRTIKQIVCKEVQEKDYWAQCTEDGERFVFKFRSKQTEQAKLLGLAQRFATNWNAECHEVTLCEKQGDTQLINLDKHYNQ